MYCKGKEGNLWKKEEEEEQKEEGKVKVKGRRGERGQEERKIVGLTV